MSENDTSPGNENHIADLRPEPDSEPESIFKLLYRLYKNLPPAVRWGVLVVTLIGFIIGSIWKMIPPTKQEQFIDYIISAFKAETPDPPHAPPEQKYNSFAEEIRARSFLTKIRHAKRYLEGGGSPANKEKAFQIYQEVLSQLSSDAIRELDQNLLAKANSDARAGYIDNALLKYKAMFEKVLNEN
jgi:hypothetical protein